MTTLPQTTSVRLPQAQTTTALAPALNIAAVGAPMTGADVWRVIRGNMWLIIAMFILSAAAGYGINLWLARKMPSFTAKGYVQVPQVVQTGIAGSEVRELPNERITNEQRTQAQIMQTEYLFSTALAKAESELRKTGWFKSFSSVDPKGNLVVDTRGAKRSLEKNFSVMPVVDSSLLLVQMKWSNPKDAKVIVEELVKLHIDQQEEQANSRRDQLTRNLRRTSDLYNLTLTQKRERIESKQVQLTNQGAGLQGVSTLEIELKAMLEHQLKLTAELSEAKGELEALTAQIGSGAVPPLVERNIDMDPQIARFSADLGFYEMQMSIDEAGTLGPESRKIKQYQTTIETIRQKLENRRDELKIKYGRHVVADAEFRNKRLETDLADTRAKVDVLRKEVSALSGALAQLRIDQEDERWWREQYQQITNKLTDVNSAADASAASRINWSLGGRPEIPETPSFPRLPVTMSLAVMCGLALALGIAFLREAMDDTVRSPRDITRVGQFNVLGIVADESDDPQVADAKLPIFDAPHSATAEQFRQVRTRLQHAASLDTIRSIMVTGPSPQDGKTTIAANLAAGLALNGRRILLVDANFRRPEIHRLFGVGNDKGFSDVLNGTASLEDVAHETRVPNLSVLASGPKPMNAAELFESQLLTDFIDRCAEDYDHVIFDSAPFLVVAEPGAMAAKVDGVVTVIRAHAESRGLLTRLRDQLRQTKAEHIGVVLNAVRAQGGGYYGRSIKTFYQYQSEA